LYENHPGLQLHTTCKSSDRISHFVGEHNDASEMVGLWNMRDALDGLDEAISDLGSTSVNEANEEDNDDDNNDNDDDNVEEKYTSGRFDISLLKKTESDTKRK